MRFAKIVFLIAGVWGVLVITPLFFIFDLIGKQDPPAINHPGFYYGFATTALAWQIAFLIIASNPIRFRPLMIAAVIEKAGFNIAVIILFLQGRMHVPDLALGIIDLLFGALFLTAFVMTVGIKQSILAE